MIYQYQLISQEIDAKVQLQMQLQQMFAQVSSQPQQEAGVQEQVDQI